MGVYTTLPSEIKEVDIIIAGGGTTGCIIASRLADADPGLSILVIEHGTDNQDNELITRPMLWRPNLYPQTGTMLYYIGKKESQLGDRPVAIGTGGILGGGSSINLTIYTRPQEIDYDAWNTKGWSENDLRPFANKAETYHGTGKKEDHGSDGPIHVSSSSFRQMELERDFISAMSQIGYPEVEDLQDLRSSNNGASHSLKYISVDGRRQDVPHTYLRPRLQDGKHENLHVLLQSQVIRVLFDKEGKRAIGVEYRPNLAFQEGGEQTVHQVKARKLVIVSCGTLGSPGVLERSGVGDATVLGKSGVPVVVDLPGVGHGYQDHQVVNQYYKSSIPKGETHDVSANYEELLKNNDKLLGWNGFDASAKIRPTESEVDALGQDFRKTWDEDYKDVPSKPLSLLMFFTGILIGPAAAPEPENSYFSMGLVNIYPYSRGHVHITGPSLGDPLDLETRYLADDKDIDLKTHIWSYKKQREAARRMKSYRGELEGHSPDFPPGSKAAVAHPIRDGADDVIEYSAEDDAAIAEMIRKRVNTCWHGLGTCKMAPRDQMGVVDDKLSVYGVQGLKVTDLSIAPGNVSSNTHNTALAFGEKAASIIIEELGLR
ncbi:alcohol oxidase-like protein [Annulohypoxylon stygium]|nr:alcohol oxidase-like protein [Annulohypoxylon stygium]